MKTSSKTLVIAGLLGLFASLPVFAAYAHTHNGKSIHQRLERQQQRIEQGIASGELTRKESKVLQRQQRKVRSLTREFRDDGRLSKKERRVLTRKLDKLSDKIWRLKHNDVYRAYRGGRHDKSRYQAAYGDTDYRRRQ
jgi:hypothetical protein